MRTISTATLSVCLGLLTSVLGDEPCLGEEALGIEVSRAEVGKYEKVEFLIRLDKEYSNPFDPDEVDLSIEFELPGGGSLRLPAFFFQQYERREMDRGRGRATWLYPLGMPVWKARFAPMEVGRYRATAVLKDRSGRRRSQSVAFECRPSERPGFLRVSKSDPRFFEFTEGRPFFAIGQNLAFIGYHAQYVRLANVDEIFGKLARNGANYLRIWTCCQDWAMAIEARKSAWGRSWGWKPPFVPMPDEEGAPSERRCVKLPDDGSPLQVSPSNPVALRPGTRYVFSGLVRTKGDAAVRVQVGRAGPQKPVASAPGQGWTPLEQVLEAAPDEFWLGSPTLRLEGTGQGWVNDLSLKEAGGGPELLWEAAVNRPVRGYYNPVDCFMLDQVIESAERHGIYLQLCLITRDLYMGALHDPDSPEYRKAIEDAKKLFRYAVARWGYSTSVATWEHFNEQDPGLPTDPFYQATGEYLEETDVYHHLRSTSTWHPSPRDCRHPELDLADVHFYLRPADKGRLRDEVDAVVDRARFLRQHAPEKPALIGEFGLANERWQPTEAMRKSQQVVDFHNAIWASALSGTSGTCLFWWWDRLDQRNAYPHYRPLADFLADVPWTSARLNETAATVSSAEVQRVGLQGRDRAYLWLFNPQAAWSSVVIEKATPREIQGATVEIPGLAPGTYRVQWWDTRQGKTVKDEMATAPSGVLRTTAPAFARDIACKIVPAAANRGEI
jgi:hypothetical protein